MPFGHATHPDAENPDVVGKEKTHSSTFWFWLYYKEGLIL